MRLRDLFPVPDMVLNEGGQDAEHFAALDRTGFWGAQGAGCLILARDTGRLLLAHRSAAVEQPNTWGTWGGAIDRDEDPADAVKREVHEETGLTGSIEVLPMFVFRKDSFRYSNFLLTIDHEFTPRLDWENQGYRWCSFGAWPEPMHFGLAALLRDPASVATMQRAVASAASRQGGDDEPHLFK